MLPDVRFQDGYQKLTEMRSLIIKQMDFKELEHFSKSLYKDLDDYRTMADWHAPLGLTDDARRVRRLERELQEVEVFLGKFPFISLEKDGSINSTRKLELEDYELLFSNYKKLFDHDNIPTFEQGQSKEEKLIMMINELINQNTKLTDSNNRPQQSLAQTIILTIVLGLIVNFLSSYILPDSGNEEQTYIFEQNSYLNSSVNVVVTDENRVIIFCNNFELRERASNDAEIITELYGIFVAKIITTENDWVLIEFNKQGVIMKGWLPKHNLIIDKD